MLKREYSLFVTLLLVCTFVFAQKSILELKQNLTISNGLAHNGVTSILQDSKGYLWFGTYDGINKYDGYNLTTFKNRVSKSTLVSNRVRALSEDANGNLWIGTDEGISLYRYDTEKISAIYANKGTGPIVRKIIFSKNKQKVFCLTEDSGVLFFDNEYKLKKKYIPENKMTNQKTLFFDGVQLTPKTYLFTTSNGLMLFDIETERFNEVLSSEITSCNAIKKIDDNTLLVAASNGIDLIKVSSDKSKFTYHKKYYKGIRFTSLLIDNLNNLWLGALNDGIIHIDNVHKLINGNDVKISTFKSNSKVLRTSSIISTVENKCWVGTFNKGIFQFNIEENPFKSFNAKQEHEKELLSSKISFIVPVDSSSVFLSSFREEPVLLNTESNKLEPLPFVIPKEYKASTQVIFIDAKKNVWFRITGEKGLFRLRPGAKKMEQITNNTIPFFNNIELRSVTQIKDDEIWLGTGQDVFKITLDDHNNFLNVQSLNTNPVFNDKKLKLARTIFLDPSFPFLWIGADSEGLFRVHLEDNKPLKELKIDHYLKKENVKTSLSSNFVSDVIRLPNNELWIATEGGGVCKVINSDTTPEFISYSEDQGLSNNAVKSILFDDENNLWITTNIGLNKLDTRLNRFIKYSTQDGLPFDDFWFTSKKLKNKNLIFSGVEGVCYFNPTKLPSKEILPRLEFGDLKIFNKSILPNDTINDRVLLNKRLNDTKEIALKHNENVFSIQLKSLHFSNPENHFLKYKLSPVNNDWIEVPSSQQNVYYSGLQPGEYVFSVMASNSLNKWTKPKEIKIVISPPYWKTNWAYTLYVLLFFTVALIALYVTLRIQKLNYNLEIEQLERNTITELNSAKLRFFSNISHDIKTPITLICGPIDYLLKQFKNNLDVTEKLSLVKRQSKNILHLINQVHDFQKADAHLLKLNYSRFYFNTFIEELVKDFEFMASSEQKKIEVTSSESNITVSADKDKLEKIFNNLINNAFKYTREGDTIKIDFKSNDKDLLVSVSDTGIGICEDDLPHIFERFFQSIKKGSNYSGGSGIGLAFSKRLVEMHYGYISAESEEGVGTTINVQLPVVKDKSIINEVKREEIILKAEDAFDHEEIVLQKVEHTEIERDESFSDKVVFYVEDKVDMRNFVSSMLSNFFNVQVFTNGQECLDRMEEEWPDIVITDLLMPELNGLELCKAIKSDIKTSHIPVILLTACNNIEDQIQGLRDGADAYIHKPFNIQHLVTRTEALLVNRKKLAERFQVGIPLTKENNLNNRNDNAFLEKLYDLMAENLDNQELDINRFAKELYLNRTHFYQKVKALTDQTPFELLKMYRLKKAAEFLTQQNLSVNEVFMMTGFKSRTHFTKVFKEKYGVTPGKYSSSIKEKYDL
ncbi:hypothetical protein AXE80_08125 [Wenyingzhuangia fucanilytica]|uniref:histidine kinase n=1 Tax=Wenyingzhuangia fucanilytica TaxID=1790137 RepID=A0A1B1Y673_9FLAO|nr:ATP-binding protein [Wenyingzhuangia fucanilytica]ANW96247.1 hypothetical protein AXE80_08125 [Wenyingzhuangia fucanilytica]